LKTVGLSHSDNHRRSYVAREMGKEVHNLLSLVPPPPTGVGPEQPEDNISRVNEIVVALHLSSR
jgi:hypothetical protein